jgi:hypothetical protein
MNKFIIPVVIVVILIAFASMLVLQRSHTDISLQQQYTQKNITDIEILETQNFDGEVPQFRLSVQSHGSFTQIPKKILLTDIKTQTVAYDLPLSESEYPNECAMHADSEMLGNMKKWDTEWFFAGNLSSADTTYTPKLSAIYTTTVIYQDGEASTQFESSNLISGVCYQTAKTIPVTPNPEEVLPEE